MAALQGTKRIWKQESEFKNLADAELVQQEIDKLASQDVNGKCRNQALVDFARQNPSSETYKCMEWNNQIAGNTDPNPKTDPKDEYNIKLSKQRAEAVKQYFVLNGILADRIVTVGNGSSKPVVKNDTEKHRAMNRRTDVSFKIIESN